MDRGASRVSSGAGAGAHVRRRARPARDSRGARRAGARRARAPRSSCSGSGWRSTRSSLRAAIAAGHAVEVHGHAHLRHPATRRAGGRRRPRPGARSAARPASSRGAGARRGATWPTYTAAARGRSAACDWPAGRPTRTTGAATPARGDARGATPAASPAAIVLAHDGIGAGRGARTARETAALIGPLVAAARERGLEPRAARRPAGPSRYRRGNPRLPPRGTCTRRDRRRRSVTCSPTIAGRRRGARRAARVPARRVRRALPRTRARSPPPATRARGVGGGARRRRRRRLGRAALRGPPQRGRAARRRSARRAAESASATAAGSACGAPTRRPARASRRSSRRADALHGDKVFCSGAGGLDRALVLARHERGPPCSSTSTSPARRGRPDVVPRRRHARLGEPPRRLPRRAGRSPSLGEPASSARAVVLARRDPHRRGVGRDRRRRRRRRARRPRRPRRARRPARARRRAHRHRARDDRPLVRARRRAPTPTPTRSRSQLREAVADAGATILDEAARATAARARSRPAPRSTAPGATSSCSCSSTGSTRWSPGSAAGSWRPGDEPRDSAPRSSTSSTPSDPDPWDFETSPYEHAKYDATIAALEGRRYARGARDRLLDRRAHRAARRALRRRCSRSTSPRPRSPSAPASPRPRT